MEVEREPVIRFVQKGEVLEYDEETESEARAAFGKNYLSELGKRAYCIALKKRYPMGDEHQMKECVEVITVPKKGNVREVFIKSALIPTGILPVSEFKHLFVFEHSIKERKFYPAGGINGKKFFFGSAKFVARGSVFGGILITEETEHWILERHHLTKDKLCDPEIRGAWEKRKEVLRFRKEVILCDQRQKEGAIF